MEPSLARLISRTNLRVVVHISESCLVRESGPVPGRLSTETGVHCGGHHSFWRFPALDTRDPGGFSTCLGSVWLCYVLPPSTLEDLKTCCVRVMKS